MPCLPLYHFHVDHSACLTRAPESLPYSIRVLLESAIRNCDEFEVTKADVENVLNWKENVGKLEIPFKPARVLLQDFTCVFTLRALEFVFITRAHRAILGILGAIFALLIDFDLQIAVFLAWWTSRRCVMQ